jgi:lipopolysaccharide/colanic/teichoic acid biosynthesis glycosyltransferase
LDAREVILSVKPGITDWASIKYKDENDVLGMAVDPHKVYVEEVLPIKIRYYVDYVNNRSFWGDVRIIFATIRALAR